MHAPVDSHVYVGECTRCLGTGDDGGFLACGLCHGYPVLMTITRMDDDTRAVLARDPEGVAEVERLAWLLLEAARKHTNIAIFGLAWKVGPWSSNLSDTQLFEIADATSLAAIQARGYRLEGPFEGHLILVTSSTPHLTAV